MPLSFGESTGLSAASSAFDHYQANRARSWARSMDNTKYQRSVNDLRAAGLNPILAASGGISGGGGASAPSAPTGSVSQGVQTSTAAQLAKETIKKLRAETRLTDNKADVVGPVATTMSEINSALQAFIKYSGGPGIIERGASTAIDALKSIKNRPAPSKAKKQRFGKEHNKYDLPGVDPSKRKTFDFK